MVKNNAQDVEKSVVEGVEPKAKARKPRKTATKATNVSKKEEVVRGEEMDLDSILNFEKTTKSAISFNQDKSVSDKLNQWATAKEVKTSKVLNSILASIVDVDNKKCKIDIEEEKEEKIQNTYKIDKDVLDVLKTEAKKRNMSLNDYLNKVLKIVLNLK